MLKQMCWLPTAGTQGTKILHLRTNPIQGWRPYTSFPEYAVRDYPDRDGSKGFATFQKLNAQGWQLIPSSQVNQVFPLQPEKKVS
ncbi:hypothetical protein IQ249_10450 [Lusitaniella coriacea LEGE 07157]|uniref:Uncharacterized protein n=1 Tax=Lusitaniella coriacea LEGE 07157 TaxID=945747 RepID=A0A8J7DW96_9CYAN|nr:hypothetical protein [Lusitaniella coriacea]MBE9116317.1 hypothetical protein [Lusitaniella coriacea LEGE 07157]